MKKVKYALCLSPNIHFMREWKDADVIRGGKRRKELRKRREKKVKG